MQELLFTAVAGLGACVLLVLAVLVLRSQGAPGSREMAAALFAMTAWAGSAALEPHASEALYGLVLKTKYSAIALTPACVVLGAGAYVRRKPIARGWRVAALAVPLATIAATWTNDLHAGMWTNPPFAPGEPRSMLLPYGAYFWRVHIPGSYALSAVVLTLLAREWRRPTHLDRLRIGLLIIGVLMPLIANALYTTGVLRTRFGPTPLALSLSGTLFAWGFFRRGLFRLAPVAHSAVFEQMHDAVLVVDASGRIALANPAALALAGRSAGEMLGAPAAELIPPASQVHPWIARKLDQPHRFEAVGGQHLEIKASPLREATGALAGHVFLLRDVTEQERTLAALRESEALVRGIVDHSPNGILRLRPCRGPDGEVRDFDCVFANAAAAEQLGRDVAALVGRPFKSAMHPHTAALFQAFRETLLSGRRSDAEHTVVRGGREICLRFIAVPAGSDLIVTTIDVSDAKLREREMRSAASEDALTGLLNRRGLEADAPSVLRDASGAPRPCALLYLDLDGFKRVNDELGHEAGDAVLCEFAARLQRCTRGPDLLARLGGDEFVLLLPETREAGARWVAQRLLDECRRPVHVNDRTLHCAPSIGIALQPEHGAELKTLVQAADRAMYEAKSQRRGVAVAAV
ncbi:MAG TPA: diguanylate cyclase [Myxococcota bacterium]|nr:diguanylate cyclase [Myxococcota bacterium]